MSDLEDDLPTENQVEAHAVVTQPKKLSRLLKKPQQAVQDEYRHPLADATNVTEGCYTKQDAPAVSERPASDPGDTLACGRCLTCLPHRPATNASRRSKSMLMHLLQVQQATARLLTRSSCPIRTPLVSTQMGSWKSPPWMSSPGQLSRSMRQMRTTGRPWATTCLDNKGTACLLGWVGEALST